MLGIGHDSRCYEKQRRPLEAIINIKRLEPGIWAIFQSTLLLKRGDEGFLA